MSERMKHIATAINSSNLYIDVNGQGKGTLTGQNVDPALTSAKVERLLHFKEIMTREVNPSSESTLFSAGQINASPIELAVLRTQISPYIRQAFYSATCIPQITVYRVDIISNTYKITEKIQYSDCYVLKCKDLAEPLQEETVDPNLGQLHFDIRPNQREETLYFFDQEGKALGQNVTVINFSQGQLSPAGGGGS